MRVVAIIPARYASTRFPGKPLAMLGTKSMIQWVVEGVQAVAGIHEVIVATDDVRIQEHVASFGGRTAMTRSTHESGTDRIAEVAAQLSDADIIVNVQGDEPFVAAGQLEALLAPFQEEGVQITTLARRIRDEADLFSPNVVKVVRDEAGAALYFSRQAIPYLRDVPLGQWLAQEQHFQHLGIYAYRRDCLLALTELPLSALEQQEKLEQLRWLAAGYTIHVAETDIPSIGIDTPADLERAANLISAQNPRK